MTKNNLSLYIAGVLLLSFVSHAQTIVFPDIMLKNKLLQSSPTEMNATNLDGDLFSIDANDDGEIQIEEAMNVQKLYIGYGSITDLTGLNYFSNLSELNCTGNNLPILDVTAIPSLEVIWSDNSNTSSINISGMPNLKKVWLLGNPISAFSVTGSPNIESMIFEDCELETFDFTGLTNLVELYLDNNLITSLVNPSQAQSLIYLTCDNNLLTSLDLSQCAALLTLHCNNNQLSDISFNESLIALECGNNNLTSIPVPEGNSVLSGLVCNGNNFTTLEIGGFKILSNISCAFMPSLTSIYCKNEVGAMAMLLTDDINLKYICINDLVIPEITQDVQNAGLTVNINTYCSFAPGGTYFIVSGNSKLDAANDGCDISDQPLPDIKFTVSDGSETESVISSAIGTYGIPVPPGTYTFTPNFENSSLFTISPPSFSVSFPLDGESFSQNFCVTPIAEHPDLEITVLPLEVARPGFDADYKVIYKNKGTVMQSGSAILEFNDAILDVVSISSTAAVESANTIQWDFSSLQPFETREIQVTFNINSPMETPAVNADDILVYSAGITGNGNEETPVDNSFVLSQIVVNSLDPNDKTCMEGNVISPEMVGKYIHYIIRFENTGTFAAENIVVSDVIDTSKFDISTLVPMSSSHPFRTRIIQNNTAEFWFEQINLPFENDSNDGYVAFKIKTLPTLVEGDVFENAASIFFDYNFPVITNTASTLIAALGTKDFDLTDFITVYPNPSRQVLNMDVKNGMELNNIGVYTLMGQQVLAIVNAKNVFSIDVSRIKQGTYFLKVDSNKGTSYTKFIKE